jgi:hypothetical protein
MHQEEPHRLRTSVPNWEKMNVIRRPRTFTMNSIRRGEVNDGIGLKLFRPDVHYAGGFVEQGILAEDRGRYRRWSVSPVSSSMSVGKPSIHVSQTSSRSSYYQTPAE